MVPISPMGTIRICDRSSHRNHALTEAEVKTAELGESFCARWRIKKERPHMAQGMSCHFARRSLFSVDPVKLLRLFRAFCLLLFQISDIRKIPVLLIEVQSITYDKPVIYGKSYIIHIDIHSAPFQVCQEAYRSSHTWHRDSAILFQIIESGARIHDILYDDNVFATDIGIQILVDLYDTGRFC